MPEVPSVGALERAKVDLRYVRKAGCGECQDRGGARGDVYGLSVMPAQQRENLPLEASAAAVRIGRDPVAERAWETDPVGDGSLVGSDEIWPGHYQKSSSLVQPCARLAENGGPDQDRHSVSVDSGSMGTKKPFSGQASNQSRKP